MNTRVLAFGTFDLFHAGHVFFLEQASALGDELYVSVARDAHIQTLKHHEPMRDQEARLATVIRQPCVKSAQLSDETLGSYGVIRSIKPNIIALGFDQDGLATDLKRWMREQGISIELTRLPKRG